MVEHRRADKKRYVEQILETIIMTGRVRQFIAAMAHLIQDLTIDHLHVIGDIYDRGSGPHRIMDCIMKTANVDIQWGITIFYGWELHLGTAHVFVML